MSEQSPRSWLTFVVVILLLPVLYVASFGPACFLVMHGLADHRFVAYAFRPLHDCTLPSRAESALAEYSKLCSDEPTYLTIASIILSDAIDAANEEKLRHRPF